MLKTKVKVSAIENLSDARYCAGMGVAVVGRGEGVEWGVEVARVL